jgi:cell division protease FtsH
MFLVAGLAVLRHGRGGRRTAESRGDASPGGSKRKARKAGQISTVTFADVAGCDEAVEEVSELVSFLRKPEPFQKVGAKMPSGVVLYGPPGTGKTLLAKALAGEAGVPFFAVSGSDFVEKYVGVGAKRVRELFAKARRCEHGAVVFIDEIDAVGGRRSGGGDGGNREADQTLNQLLAELDGFHSRAGVVVVGATNRLDTLDPALLRPGRFSRQIEVSTPNEPGRLAILRIHSTGKPLGADVDLERLAHITAGNSGAELAEILNEAAIWAARDSRVEIEDADLWEGLCRVIAGPRKASSMLAGGEREIVAYHEAGHVLAGELCPTQDRTEHATINPRGRALGFALKGRTDRGLHSEQFLHESLIFVLGGRAAEYVQFNTVSSGAANDLQQANLTARTAIEEWGLSARIGQLTTAGGQLSASTQAKVDEEVARLVGDAYIDAVNLIGEHADQLEHIAKALLASGDIDRPEIELAMRGALIAPRKPRQSHAPAPQLEPVPAGEPSGSRWAPRMPARLRRPSLVAPGGRAIGAVVQRVSLRRRARTE